MVIVFWTYRIEVTIFEPNRKVRKKKKFKEKNKHQIHSIKLNVSLPETIKDGGEGVNVIVWVAFVIQIRSNRIRSN